MTTPVTLSQVGMTIVLYKLAKNPNPRAKDLYGKLMGSWGHRPDRQRVTVKLTEADLQFLESLQFRKGILGRDVLESGWLVFYQHPRKTRLGVLVHTKKKPTKRRTFTVAKGKHRLVATQVARIGTKEAVRMARKKKAVEEDELDELEGLEDLDDLDELDEEEPEDDEDEDEDEEPAPKRKAKKAPAKKAPAKKTRKKAVVEEEDEDDEDEDEEDEDEDEEPAPKRKTKSKTSAKKSTSKASSAKKSSNGSKGNLPATRELPKGQLGPQDIAELVGGDCDARYVRIFLRDSEDYEREEGSRWAFSKTEARSLVKEIKAARKSAGVS